ncbi:MAG: transposase [Candidatus Lokiarchaeota archaeon]|nr:transposase [Candidatus Lokiarchaeota archaeon]
MVIQMDILPKTLNPFSSQEKTTKKLKRLSRELLNHPLFQIRGNAVYSPSQIMKLFVTAAMKNRSAEAISKGKPSADNAFIHIKDKTTIDNIEEMLKHFVDKKFIRTLRRKFPTLKLNIAIDFTPEAFYGDKTCEYVTGYEPKNGTYYCFKFLTVALVVRGARYLLYAYPVYRGDDRIWLLNRTFEFLEEIEMKPDLLLLDREFYDASVFALFREKSIAYEMPAKQDSHFKRVLKDCDKLPAVVHGYEITNTQGESECVDLVILEDNEHEKKRIFGYVTNIHVSEYKDDVYILVDNYKLRWGIETSHRVHDNFRIKTCCKEGNVRYFFFVIAFLLYNFWIYVNLIMSDYQIGENYQIHITVDGLKDLLIDFFRNISAVVHINIAM